MTDRNVHVVGAGMAGLATATKLAEAGVRVALYEGASVAGGRCRSFYDETMGATIDNGNHLVLSGNSETISYLERTGGIGETTSVEPVLEFVDLETDDHWVARLDGLSKPWLFLSPGNRVHGAQLIDYVRSLVILRAAPDTTVEQVLSHTGQLYRRFWVPFCRSVLNTEPEHASAQLLGRTVREIRAAGASGCLPLLTKNGLGDAFVAPALRFLQRNGAVVEFNHRCGKLFVEKDRVVGLKFSNAMTPIGSRDIVVLATSIASQTKLLGTQIGSLSYRPIVNAHFRSPEFRGAKRIIGVVGGSAEWIFCRDDVASVTTSSASELVDLNAEEIRDVLWRDVSRILGQPQKPPVSRVIKEKRATLTQTIDFSGYRSGTVTRYENCLLAGDWTDTGLPLTIESAVKSGHSAAASALSVLNQ